MKSIIRLHLHFQLIFFCNYADHGIVTGYVTVEDAKYLAANDFSEDVFEDVQILPANIVAGMSQMERDKYMYVEELKLRIERCGILGITEREDSRFTEEDRKLIGKRFLPKDGNFLLPKEGELINFTTIDEKEFSIIEYELLIDHDGYIRSILGKKEYPKTEEQIALSIYQYRMKEILGIEEKNEVFTMGLDSYEGANYRW